MDLSDFQRKAVLLIFITILIGSVLLARKEPLKTEAEKGVVERSSAPRIQLTVTPTPIPIKIDINTADNKQVMELPGIGQKLAGEIINYRTRNGPFVTIDDLLNVPGIGEKRLARIKEMIDLPEATPRSSVEISKPEMSEADEQSPSQDAKEPLFGSYDSRIDPKAKCPYCKKQLWQNGMRKMKYIKCPHCLKAL